MVGVSGHLLTSPWEQRHNSSRGWVGLGPSEDKVSSSSKWFVAANVINLIGSGIDPDLPLGGSVRKFPGKNLRGGGRRPFLTVGSTFW